MAAYDPAHHTHRPPRRRAPVLLRLIVALTVVATGALVITGSPASAAAGTDTLYANERLNPDERLVSNDGRTILVMQGDGNLVLRAPGNRPIWASDTGGNPGSIALMQGDGNLVVIAPGNRPIWATNTGGNANAILRLQSDGNLLVIAPGNRPIWATGTQVPPGDSNPPPPTDGGECPADGSRMDAVFYEQTGHSNTDLRLKVRWRVGNSCTHRVYRAGSAKGTLQSACARSNWIPRERFRTYGFQAVGGGNYGQRSTFKLDPQTKDECGAKGVRYGKGNFAIHAAGGFRRSGNGWVGSHSVNLTSLGCIKLSTYNFANLYDVWKQAGAPGQYTVQVVRNQGLPAATVGLTYR